MPTFDNGQSQATYLPPPDGAGEDYPLDDILLRYPLLGAPGGICRLDLATGLPTTAAGVVVTAGGGGGAAIDTAVADTTEARVVGATQLTGSLVYDAYGPMRVVSGRASEVDGGRVLAIAGGRQLAREAGDGVDVEWYRPNAADVADEAAVLARYPQLASETLRSSLLDQLDRVEFGGDGAFDVSTLTPDEVAVQAALEGARLDGRPVRIDRPYTLTRALTGFGYQHVKWGRGGSVTLASGSFRFPNNKGLKFYAEYGPIAEGSPYVEERVFGSPDAMHVRDWGVDATGPYVEVTAEDGRPTALVGEEVHGRLGINPKDSAEPARDYFGRVVAVGAEYVVNREARCRLYLDAPVDAVLPTQSVTVSAVVDTGDDVLGKRIARVDFAAPLEFELKAHDPKNEEAGGTGPAHNTTVLYFREGAAVLDDAVEAKLWDNQDYTRRVGDTVPVVHKTPLGAMSVYVYDETQVGTGLVAGVAVGMELRLGYKGGILRVLSRPDLVFEGVPTLHQEDPAAVAGAMVDVRSARSVRVPLYPVGTANRPMTWTGCEALHLGAGFVDRLSVGTGNPVAFDFQNVTAARFGLIQVRAYQSGAVVDHEGALGTLVGDRVHVTCAPDAQSSRSMMVHAIEAGSADVQELYVTGGTPGADGVVPVPVFSSSSVGVGVPYAENVRYGTVRYGGSYRMMRTDIVEDRLIFEDAALGVSRVFDLRERRRVTQRVSGTEKVRLAFAGVPRRITALVDAEDRATLQALADAGHLVCRMIRPPVAGQVEFSDLLEIGRETVMGAAQGAGFRAYSVSGGDQYAETFEVQVFVDPDGLAAFPDGLPLTSVTWDVEYWTTTEVVAREDPGHPEAIAFSHRLVTAPLGDLAPATERYVAAAVADVEAGAVGDLSVTEQKLAAAAVTPSKIATDAVTRAKIEDAAVNGLKIADGAVTGAKIAADTVKETNLAPAVRTKLNASAGGVADGGVTEVKLATAAVTSAKIATDAVTRSKIVDTAVNGPKLADGAVTGAKIAADTVAEANLAPAVRAKLDAGGADPAYRSTYVGGDTAAGRPADLLDAPGGQWAPRGHVRPAEAQDGDVVQAQQASPPPTVTATGPDDAAVTVGDVGGRKGLGSVEVDVWLATQGRGTATRHTLPVDRAVGSLAASYTEGTDVASFDLPALDRPLHDGQLVEAETAADTAERYRVVGAYAATGLPVTVTVLAVAGPTVGLEAGAVVSAVWPQAPETLALDPAWFPAGPTARAYQVEARSVPAADLYDAPGSRAADLASEWGPTKQIVVPTLDS